MKNTKALQAFVTVVKYGSFNAGAERLNCSATSVSRLVKEFEQYIGQPLLLRTTRNVALNDAGKRLFPQCEAIIESISTLNEMAQLPLENVEGELRVACTTTFAQKRLIPLLPDFVEQYPKLTIHWLLSDDRIDLSAQGADISIRVTRLDDSSMVARHLANCEIWLVAAPSLLKKFGMPTQLSDIASMPCAICTVPRFKNYWPLQPEQHVQGPVWTDCGDASREVAVAGLGVAFLPDYMVEDAVNSGQLVRLFPDQAILTFDIALLFPGKSQISPAARAFGDFLISRFSMQK
ncbi:LysR family transcriptional regulator [Alteromonas sp. AMM-1]|uniref:LysR family transcriptional regulator n=1 Tax=Alteromonas sp. AMM-1 TaxID=3394233 RepID=UPI0039A4A09A